MGSVTGTRSESDPGSGSGSGSGCGFGGSGFGTFSSVLKFISLSERITLCHAAFKKRLSLRSSRLHLHGVCRSGRHRSLRPSAESDFVQARSGSVPLFARDTAVRRALAPGFSSLPHLITPSLITPSLMVCDGCIGSRVLLRGNISTVSASH